MRLDLVLPNQGDFMVEAVTSARRFEEMGWDGLWVTDHVVGAEEYAAAYGAKWLDVITAMSYIAAQTSRVRVGSSVLVLPYRDPVLTAKMIASLDQLSGGRIDLGVGTGYSRVEFVALGREHLFAERGAVSDEALDVLLACWSGGPLSFHGTWFEAEKVSFEPPPLQGARVPIWVGARVLAGNPLRRAATYADYWYPNRLEPDEIRAGGDRLNDMAGREVSRAVRLLVGDEEPQAIADLVGRYEEVGCVAVTLALAVTRSLAAFEDSAAALLHAARA